MCIRDRDHRQTIGVAIRVPAPFGPLLQAKRAEFKDPLADLIPAHVTLLGPTVIHQVARPALVEHLEQVSREVGPFPMALRGTGTFRPVSDVVFVQVARGISGCERLEQRIRSGEMCIRDRCRRTRRRGTWATSSGRCARSTGG